MPQQQRRQLAGADDGFAAILRGDSGDLAHQRGLVVFILRVAHGKGVSLALGKADEHAVRLPRFAAVLGILRCRSGRTRRRFLQNRPAGCGREHLRRGGASCCTLFTVKDTRVVAFAPPS